MASIITGLFNNHSNYKTLESDLENAGIDGSQYIVYLNNSSDEHFSASVQVRDDAHADSVSEIFNKNDVNKTYLFNNMTIQEASNYEDLKKRIEVLAAAQIPNTPDINIKETDSGIDSQVKF
ncbi:MULTISPECIES: hypothetical protein [Soonwooa]|uniref:General stress protein 17M-like domain-containing protein n=1 Tax=Soonwooa buanensis TaxID=619805 RepID=A0A1T5DT09_9FLAO|nr:hypothetical protein [Soonwooa buanensis]SKB74878.1 hypothetical protein SAMN05660477_00990 [Soonwooa buanensis]